MLGKLLASIGVGSAKVDTRLAKATYRQGELISGDIFVQGGKAKQKIDSIYLYLIMQNLDDQQEEVVLDEFLLADAFVISENETKMVPFEFQLPHDTPVTTGGSPIYLKTGLDVKMAVDPDDHDGFEVLPHLLVDQLLTAMEDIGFQLNLIAFDYESYHERHPFVQKYQFQPIGAYRDILDELTLIFYPGEQETGVLMQANRKAIDMRSSMEEALNMDERFVRFEVSADAPDLSALLEKNLRSCIS